MPKLSNKQVVEAVVSEMPIEHGEILEGLDSSSVYNTRDTHPSAFNSFISTLTNKVTKSVVFSKIYTNQLAELKKGVVEYGDSIEEIFVQMAQGRGFGGNWEDAGTPEADLIRKLVPKVSAMYVKVNVDYKAKATVMDKQLRKAFINEGGLSNLITQIVGSITSKIEYQEFMYTKGTINGLVEGKTIAKIDTAVAGNAKAIMSPIKCGESAPIKQTLYSVKCANVTELSAALREVAGNMQFPTTNYNLAGELTWSLPEDLVLVTTPATIAALDVNVLANAFNISKAELTTKTILIDELPKTIITGAAGAKDREPQKFTGAAADVTSGAITDGAITAILMDKDLIQIWDTWQGAGTFHNPDGEYTNHFANREGIFATCLFANIAVFHNGTLPTT